MTLYRPQKHAKHTAQKFLKCCGIFSKKIGIRILLLNDLVKNSLGIFGVYAFPPVDGRDRGYATRFDGELDLVGVGSDGCLTGVSPIRDLDCALISDGHSSITREALLRHDKHAYPKNDNPKDYPCNNFFDTALPLPFPKGTNGRKKNRDHH